MEFCACRHPCASRALSKSWTLTVALEKDPGWQASQLSREIPTHHSTSVSPTLPCNMSPFHRFSLFIILSVCFCLGDRIICVFLLFYTYSLCSVILSLFLSTYQNGSLPSSWDRISFTVFMVKHNQTKCISVPTQMLCRPPSVLRVRPCAQHC